MTPRCRLSHNVWIARLILTWFCSIFLYLVLSAAFAGTCYFVYNTWFASFFPQTKKPRAPKAVVIEKEPLSGGEGSGVDVKTYDESWIPQDHINRPTARRVKSGASKKKMADE